MAETLRDVLIRNLRPVEADAVQPDLERYLRRLLELQRRAIYAEWDREKEANRAR